jgi:HK97 gp10 family phage protein
MATLDAKTQAEIAKIINAFNNLSKKFDKKGQQKILKKGATVIRSAVKSLAPESSDTHFRYDTGKLDKSKRAAKGSGQIVAAYEPGNFKRSIRIQLFKRSNAVFVGPVVAKGKKGGNYSGNKVDAYYAHIVEHGSIHYGGIAPIRRGFTGSKSTAGKAIEIEAKRLLKEFERNNKI